MSPELIVIAIIVGAIILFTLEIFSIEVTALIVMASLMLTDVISVQEAVSGFSNPATLTVLAMLILSAGLQETGIINFIGEKTIQLKISREIIVMAVVMFMSGLLSAFINNTAVVAIFLPMVVRLAERKRVSANKLLMGLSFGAMLGGSCTVIGSSTNLLISDISFSHGLGKLSMFELTPLGGILFILMILFMVFIGRHLIRERRKREEELTKGYQIQDYLAELIIPGTSPLIGKNLEETRLTQSLDLDILQIVREDGITYLPQNVEVLQENDVLIVKTHAQKLMELKRSTEVKFKPYSDLVLKEEPKLGDQALMAGKGALVEVIVGPNSSLVQKRMKNIPFRAQYHAVPLAVRGKRGLEIKQLGETRLNIGYSLLLETTEDSIQKLYASDDFIIMKEWEKKELKKDKALIAMLIIAGVVLSASFGLVPILVSAWTGCVAMFITRCIRIQKVYDTVDWRVFFLLAGIIPLGLALEQSGTGAVIATFITDHLASYGPAVILSILFLFTALLSGYISNNAVAVLLAPIAITVAQQLNVDPKPFLLSMVFAANSSFLTPIGYQTNTMIYGAGQYEFKDFLIIGGLMTLVVWVLVSVLLPLFYF